MMLTALVLLLTVPVYVLYHRKRTDGGLTLFILCILWLWSLGMLCSNWVK